MNQTPANVMFSHRARDLLAPALRASAIGAAIIIVGLFSSSADAFRPSARWLVQKAMARHIKRNLKSLRADFDVVRYDVESHPRGYQTTRVDLYVAPNQLRRETELDGGMLLEIQDGKRSVRDIPGKGRSKGKARPTLWDMWFTSGPPLEAPAAQKRLTAAMTALGVDVDTVSYSRFDSRVNYVIGSKPWEPGKAQVWLDKESLNLSRVVWFSGADKKVKNEMRLLGWGSSAGGEWLPEVLERYRGGELVERATLTNVERNKPVDKAAVASE